MASIKSFCSGIIAGKDTVNTNEKDIEHLISWLHHKRISLCSGYFAPVHSGHIEYIEESSRCGDFCVVAVNDNESMKSKKGFVVIDEIERLKIVSCIRYVDLAIVFSGDNTSELIKLLKPKYFCNGGDRSTIDALNKEEVAACKEIDCQILLGVGGKNKTNSSSDIIKNILTNAKL